MISSIAILIISTALFLFYIQTVCEKVLRREFRRAYFKDVLNAIDLEFPRLREGLSANAPMSYSQIRLALKCDYFTLSYLVKNGNPKRRGFSWQEKMLKGYFHVLLFILPLRYALRFRERQSVTKLTAILYHFANLVGESVAVDNASNVVPIRQY